MKFWEAMKALEEGKKVRCKKWVSGSYIQRGANFPHLNRIGYVAEIEEEWELYEEPVKMFSFSDMVKRLKEKKRFKRVKWKENTTSYGEHPLILNDNGIVCFCSGSRSYIFTIEDFDANDWIEVK